MASRKKTIDVNFRPFAKDPMDRFNHDQYAGATPEEAVTESFLNKCTDIEGTPSLSCDLYTPAQIHPISGLTSFDSHTNVVESFMVVCETSEPAATVRQSLGTVMEKRV